MLVTERRASCVEDLGLNPNCWCLCKTVVHILENDVESDVQNRTDSLHKMNGSEVEGNFSTNTGFVHVYVDLEILGALFKSDQVLASLDLWSFG